jgi:hypothetical protein
MSRARSVGEKLCGDEGGVVDDLWGVSGAAVREGDGGRMGIGGGVEEKEGN